MNAICLMVICATFLQAELQGQQQSGSPGFSFPIRPGTEEWVRLRSLPEQIAACEIPVSRAKEISTDQLIETCANYPLLPALFLFRSSPEDGYQAFKGMFFGAKEILTRTNLAVCVANNVHQWRKDYLRGATRFSRERLLMFSFLAREEQMVNSPNLFAREMLLKSLLALIWEIRDREQDTIVSPEMASTIVFLFEKRGTITNKGKRYEWSNIPDGVKKYKNNKSQLDAIVQFSKDMQID